MKVQSATIYTMAEKAGVSAATVSRALNNDKLINIKTRKKLQRLAEKLGYKKSPLARNLSLGKSGIIAALLPSINNPVYTYLAARIIEHAQKKNSSVFLNYSEGNPAREKKIIKSFRDVRADGFIIFSASGSRSEIAKLGKPVVFRGPIHGKSPFDTVWVNFRKGAYDAVKYLIKLGHRDIRYMGHIREKSCKAERPSGFIEAMNESGMKYSMADIGLNIEEAYRKSLKLLSKEKPDALLVQSDYLAFGVLRAIGELKIRVPEDISIISFDNAELSNYGMAPLTTMAQPIDEQAGLLVNMLLGRIKGDKSEPCHMELETRMIIRHSTGKRI